MTRYLRPTFAFMFAMILGLVVPCWSLAQEKPNLLIVSVGVSKYVNKRFETGVVYAAKDAQNIADAFIAQQGKQYDRVESKVLLDEKATTSEIRAAIDWLEKKATPQSHVIVFLAGHAGPNSLGTYQYLTHDSNALLPSTRLQGSWLRDRLQKMPGKRFLLLDTCHSGGFDFQNTDFTALASCGAKEFSGELADIQNGFFTRCLLEGIQGPADLNSDGAITIAELEAYVRKNLPNLTKGKQHLTAHRPASIANDLPMIQLNSPVPFTKTGPRMQMGR